MLVASVLVAAAAFRAQTVFPGQPIPLPVLATEASRFEGPLAPTAETSPEEDAALLAAIARTHAAMAVDDFGALEDFVASSPRSGWRLAVLTNSRPIVCARRPFFQTAGLARCDGHFRAILELGEAAMSTTTTTDLAEHVLATLRAHEAELRRAGIRHLSLFGSVARGDAEASSDVDLAAELDPEARIGLFALEALERRLADLVGRKVDLLPEPVEKPRLRANIDRDRRRAF